MAIQEIGIGIDISRGNFSNTVFKDDVLKLVQIGEDSHGNPIYVENGYWESEIIRIQDKITAFKNVARTLDVHGNASYKMYVQTSDDGFVWGTYEPTLPTGEIVNIPAQYARVKIEIFSEKLDSDFYVDDFKQVGKYKNEFIESEQGFLSLKKSYTDIMRQDDSVFVKTIESSNYKKIDRIRVAKG